MQKGSAISKQAQVDAHNLYASLRSLNTTVDLSGKDLVGMNLTAGVYNFAGAAGLTGNLTLNGNHSSSSVFIIRVRTPTYHV